MPLLDVDIDVAKDLFELNVFSIIRVTQAFAPLLIAARGTIVTIGSISGVAPMPWNGVYGASKAAAHLLNDNLRLELAPLGVKVLLVVAGGVMTNFTKNVLALPLPKNSSYVQVKDMVPPPLAGRKFDVRTIVKPHQFAENVVREVVKAQPRARLWTGTWAELTWAVNAFGRATVWDRIMSKIYDLKELKEKLQAAKKSV
jgi:1-acylglycerone phosphate reductase